MVILGKLRLPLPLNRALPSQVSNSVLCSECGS